MDSTQTIIIICSVLVLFWAVFALWLDGKRKRKICANLTNERDRLRQALVSEKDSLDKSVHKLDWYRSIIDATKDMILVFGVTEAGNATTFRDVNKASCEMLGYSRDELLGMTPLEIETVVEPEIQRATADVDMLTLSNSEMLARDSVFSSRNMQHLIKQVMSDEIATFDSSFVAKGGRRIPVEITAQRMGTENDGLIVYMVRDISERKKAALALRESEQRFKDFFASSPIGAASYDAQRKLLNANLSCLRIFGAPDRNEFAKFNMFDNAFLPNSAKDSINRGETVRCEVVFDFKVLLEKHSFASSRRGKAYFDILFNNLGRDHEHNPLGYLIQVQDITERREAEATLQLREAQLRQAQKMEAIGTMAGGIAHDFNNILTPILGYSDIGIELSKPEDRLHGFMKEIKNATMRAKDLVHQILIFSRQTEETQTLIHLTPIVKEVAKQQSAGLPESIEVNHAVRVDEDLVMANPTQIHQVLTNLCTNAAYAMREEGGELDIRLTSFNMGWRHRQEFPQLKKGRYLRISVKDTGCGIEDCLRERIFDPFFSTKPSGEGTGMGLSVVHGIISALGGAINVDSVVGEGSIFNVALPLVEAAPVEENVIWSAPPSGNERILFVDDEQGIAKMATHMLTSLGYQPVVTSSSLKALELFEDDPHSFDILVSDQVMPDLTGGELSAKLREIRPDLPIVICSGFADQLTPEKIEELGINEFLPKPITRKDLGEAIQRALGKAVEKPTLATTEETEQSTQAQTEAETEDES